MDSRKENIYGSVKVIQDSKGEWGMTDLEDNVIVPFGKYAWIDGFDSGLARVRFIKKHTEASNEDDLLDWIVGKCGIINEKGEEVLPAEYNSVWNFFGKNRYSTKVVKDGVEKDVYFKDLNPLLLSQEIELCGFKISDDYYIDDYESEYAGSYAYDVMGYSDEDINDAFEGDPDNYWNID